MSRRQTLAALTRRFDIPNDCTALDQAFENLNARIMAPALANLPALDLPIGLTSEWNWQIPDLDRAFSQLGAVTEAAARINSLSGLDHLGAATEAVAALNVRSVATATLGLESVFDFQQLCQTSLVERCVPAPRPIDLDVVPAAPPVSDPALRDELDAMWAEIDALRERGDRPPGDELRIQGF